MLKEIRNSRNDGAIDQLNHKIRDYNDSLARNNPTESLHLLQEINYIHRYIHRFLIDHPSPNLNALIDLNTFEGIGNELVRFGLPKTEGAMADTVLMSQLSENSGLPTSKQWKKLITGSWFNSCFNSPSKLATSITNRLKTLNELKTNSQMMPSTENRRDYFYGLQSLKRDLLDIISFDVNDSSELKQFRHLLLQINGEIQQTGQLLESFKKKQMLKRTVIESDVYQELSQLSAFQMSQLTFILYITPPKHK